MCEAERFALREVFSPCFIGLTHSPDDIRKKSQELVDEKHRFLQRAFWSLAIGILASILLLLFRLKL